MSLKCIYEKLYFFFLVLVIAGGSALTGALAGGVAAYGLLRSYQESQDQPKRPTCLPLRSSQQLGYI